MKHYNIQNYIRYKADLEIALSRIPKKIGSIIRETNL